MSEVIPVADEDSLVAAVTDALESGTTLSIRGTDTKSGFGRAVVAARVLDLSGLSGITLYEPDELVLAVRAGTPRAEIEALLERHAQMLAFEPMDTGPLYGRPAGEGTMGGLFACGLAGPRRLSHGGVRDHALGLRAVSGRGEVFKSGGRVMKNVTGYDLPRLFAGALGTLGVMSEITLKVLPRPQTEQTLLLFGLDAASRARAMSAAMGSPCEVSGAAALSAAVSRRREEVPADVGVVALRLEGFPPSVKARRDMLITLLMPFGAVEVLEEAASRAFWLMVRDALPFAAHPERALWRISTAPMAGPILAQALEDTLGAQALCDWAGGLLTVEMPDGTPRAAQVRAALAPHGGHATLMRAGSAEREGAVFQPLEGPLAALSARVKASFDPASILNPGRMYPEGGAAR